MLSHRFFDHFCSVLVAVRVLLAGVDAHLQHFGLHVVVHISLKILETSIKYAIK
jgi:hypothetical protein